MFINKNPVTIENLKIRPYALRNLKNWKPKDVNGLDTETLNGYCRLLCDSDGNNIFPKDIDSILNFLTHDRFRHTHNFFYNIRFDFQAIIKYFPKDALDFLYDTSILLYNNYKIKYIPKKLFRIIIQHRTYAFYDLAQFYKRSLELASREYLNKEKFIENIDREKLGTDKSYWKGKEDKIVRYCINDAKLTKELGIHLQNTFKDKMDFTPKKYLSRASVSKEFFRKYCSIPDPSNVPKYVLSYALRSYFGGRFECTKKGHFHHIFSIDINSAYPSTIANLIDITQGKWEKVRDMTDKAYYGFYFCKVDIPYLKNAPLPFRIKPTYTIYPCGEFYTVMTKQEVEMYQKDININILRGCEFYPEKIVYPFKTEIQRLYKVKNETYNYDFKYDMIKVIMNSLYGCFYEKTYKDGMYYTGKLFNPIYASIITATTRLEMYKIIKDNQRYVIASATDGILLTKKPKLKYSKEMGEWDLKREGNATIIRSGIYQIGKELKSRGIKRMSKIRTPNGHFNSIFDYIASYPKLSEYKIISNRPIQLGECIIHTKAFSKEDLNVFYPFEYTININKDLKRLWDGEFNCGGDLMETNIDSSPILLS